VNDGSQGSQGDFSPRDLWEGVAPRPIFEKDHVMSQEDWLWIYEHVFKQLKCNREVTFEVCFRVAKGGAGASAIRYKAFSDKMKEFTQEELSRNE
jgi:hypothetical protein